ncbi:MAG: FlgD immunoglobulin-like domain containing protein [Ignavibacteriaceae bacterium]
MLRRIYTMILAVTLLLSTFSLSQTYQGPSAGSVSSGAIVNTNSFPDFPISEDTDPIISGEFNLEGISNEPLILETDGSKIFPTTYVEDNNVGDNPFAIGDNAMLLEKFNVGVDNNVIPPDPTIAVGPNHVMVLTNNGVGIRIYDKQGTLLKSINSNTWWSAVWPSQSGDPQILYDHYTNRWFMLFMQVDDAALTAGNLIAYSDDDDPLGTWYMYRLDGKLHGTVNSNTWGDYPQIGFDEQAIYVMTRCFSFGGGFNYTKLRIISKAELYASNAGPLTYKDIWDITVPGSTTRPDVIHPSFQFGNAGEHYLLYANRSGGNFYSFYKITDPITSPVLTGVNITVPFYGGTPNANQLGGGTPLIEANGSHMKTAPVYRDGFLYATHSIRNSVYPNYASIKYVKIDVATNTVVESAELGADKYFYIYPAIAVDKDGNVGITCSRSADGEYIGSYFTTRRASDPAGLSSSRTLQPGLGNYIITFGGTRNRWGDYLGVFLDPADEYSFWMVSQFASGTNAYSCVVGQVRLEPFTGIFVYTNPSIVDTLDFGRIEVGSVSDTIDIVLSNYGTDDLVISDIPGSVGDFSLLDQLTFPITLSSFDSLTLRFLFSPSSQGEQSIEYTISNNSSGFSSVPLKGFGWQIFPANNNQLYAISGTQNSGNFVSIDKLSGAGTNVGQSLFTDFKSIAIKPDTNLVYGMRSNTTESEILKINGTGGDAYSLFTLPIPNMYTIAFDKDGILYGISTNKNIYTIDLNNGTLDSVSTIVVMPISVAFDPTTNELWGTYRKTTNPKDLTVKIDLGTGDTTIIGSTGFAQNTIDIAFDETGILYGTKGIGATVSDLFTIDKTTGIGTVIGSIGLKDIRALAYSYDEVTSITNEKENIPINYSLGQNYPNPFNPSTQIKFSLPINSNVKIVVYNLIGEVVRELVNNNLTAGAHSVQWNADDISGNKVSSGIYFYELKANGVDGSQFSQVRKMVLLK